MSAKKPLKAYVLFRYAEKNSLYTSWLDQLSVPWELVEDFLPGWVVPEDAGILITHSHYTWEDLAFLRRAYHKNQVPVLLLCDGILEYRNTWQHPQLADGALFQPVFGHKLACLGHAQARILESWGNAGKCEVVGLPRLDPYLADPPPVQQQGPFRLLVTSAMNPAFDERQREITVKSLRSLQTRLESMKRVGVRPIQVTWRLTRGLEEDIGMRPVELREQPGLMETIDQSDAVITTPSTILLESALRKRPTALLDFHNCPHYVSPAWLIQSKYQIEEVIEELAAPPAPKMLFQTTMLHEQLNCRTPAVPRMVQLIEAMIEGRRQSIQRRRPLDLPARILGDTKVGFAAVPEKFELADLFPDNPVFRNDDVERLKIELSSAIHSLGSMPLEVAERQREVVRVNRVIDEMIQRTIQLNSKAFEAEKKLRAARIRSV